MGKQTAKQYRQKAVDRQKRLRERNKAMGKRRLSVWIDQTASRRLSRLQKKLGHPSQAETVMIALKALDDEIRAKEAQAIRDKALQNTAKNPPAGPRNG